MSRQYSELVIEGPFMLIKGFLLGFLSVKNPEGRYFFHRKSGIRRETFKEFLKEFFEMDNYVHLCLENDLIEPFQKAIERYKQTTHIEIQSQKGIEAASFSFAYEFYNEALANTAKDIIENLPENVTLVDYYPYESRDEKGVGVETYSPLHEFTARAKGTVQGDFEGVIDLYLNLKRSEISESVICSDIRLEFE